MRLFLKKTFFVKCVCLFVCFIFFDKNLIMVIAKFASFTFYTVWIVLVTYRFHDLLKSPCASYCRETEQS